MHFRSAGSILKQHLAFRVQRLLDVGASRAARMIKALCFFFINGNSYHPYRCTLVVNVVVGLPVLKQNGGFSVQFLFLQRVRPLYVVQVRIQWIILHQAGKVSIFGAIWPVWYESIVLLVSLGYTTKQGRLHALGVGHPHLDTLIPSNDFLFAKKCFRALSWKNPFGSSIEA